MNKFKVGDRVIYKGASWTIEGAIVLELNEYYEVSEILNDEYVRVKGLDNVDILARNFLHIHKPEFHSSHYESDSSIEPITYIMSNHLSFNRGNIVKYAARAGKKAGQQALDCHKIIDYTMLMAIEEGIELNEEELIKLIRYRFDWNKSKGRG